MRYSPYPAYKPSGVEWLGEMPEGWEAKRLKILSTSRVSNVDKVPSDDELPVRLCNYTDVYYNDHIHPGLDLMETTAKEEEIRRFGLHINDVVITKDSEEWNDIAVPALVTETAPDLVCGYHLAIIRPDSQNILGTYLFHALQSSVVNHQFQIAATGVTRYGLPKSAIGEALLPVPPLIEQNAIADFLDRQTTKIDTLVAKRRALIEKLKEKRTALISQTVTRGLPPDAARAAGLDPHPPLKPSGVEWLGEVPEGWKILKIKRLSIVKRGASPRPIDDPIYFDENSEYGWVRIADVTASNKYLEKTTQYISEYGKIFSIPLEPGDFFLSIAGSVGKPIITKIKCCIHDGFVYFPEYNQDNEFLYYVFASGQPYLGLGKLGTQLNLNTDTIGDIKIGLPSLPDQRAIVDFLDRETAKIDRMVSLEEAVMERQQEYRSALITAAVTGKIDVRSFSHEHGTGSMRSAEA